MTHDELIQKINDEIDNCKGLMIGAVLGETIKAVVKLHKPIEGKCKADFPTLYPCSTIQTIEKEINDR